MFAVRGREIWIEQLQAVEVSLASCRNYSKHMMDGIDG